MTTLNADGSSKSKVLLTSILFMGLSHILYFKQYLKGALFALVEVLTLVLIPTFATKVYDMITLGEVDVTVPVMMRDNSIYMLIDGIMILAVIAILVSVYVISVRGALAEYSAFCARNGELNLKGSSLRSAVGKSFPIFGLAPAVLLIIFFVIVPLVFSAAVAFTNYSAPSHIPPSASVDWVGFENFKAMFGGESTWTGALGRVAIWTLIWGTLATLTCYAGGLIMAVVLNESKIKIKPVFRSIFILPYAVPAVVSMLVWKNLLNGSFGIVNRTLMELGLINNAIPWLSDVWLCRFVCVLVNLWAGFSYFMLLVMGNMTAISPDIYEAASIDGASKFYMFRKITLPLVLYQTTPLIIMSFTHNINNFGAIYFLTGGLPKVADSTITSAGGTDILVTWIYNLTVTLMKYNYASVLAIVIFVVMAPFAIWSFRRTKSYKEGEV
ncbi:maltose/maltodextrin ABC transporter, permease protein MalF [Lachnospiraceae bacterium KM106-2]|nr:maltose/maltodextrin ABC transporter, permease protein MalF [Lachnospiraceae bacterium KM106-2]